MHVNILRIFTDKEVKVTVYIGTTTHALAREWLSKPDGFLTATLDDKEYIITDYKRTKGHANVDDSVPYWTLNLMDIERSNKR